jgi:hypothetical protein
VSSGRGSVLKPHIHYEAAFEDCLRSSGIPYVAVDEAKRAAFRDARLKSFDFIAYSANHTNWLVDVKGRRWAPRQPKRKPVWENWVTQADLDGLQQWERVFGVGFRALFVFAYWLQPEADPPPEIVHAYHDQRYVFVGVPLEEYRLHARIRSPKWGTVNLPTAEFARYARPLADWL